MKLFFLLSWPPPQNVVVNGRLLLHKEHPFSITYAHSKQRIYFIFQSFFQRQEGFKDMQQEMGTR